MPVKINTGESVGYAYPLLIKQLLHTPLATAANQEIVYRDCKRYTYRTFRERIGRLANLLGELGVAQGSTVAVLDWDSHRYLECYFAVPMMGAILQTVNVRLAPEQVLYTLNHAKADVLLVNSDFLPMVEGMRDKLGSVKAVVLIHDAVALPTSQVAFAGEYEALLDGASPDYEFQDFDENAVATTFYTTGTTGLPKGVCFTHRQIVLHTLAALGALASASDGQCFRQGDVYMPITPMFHVHAWGIPYVATLLGVKQVYPGRYDPDGLLELRRREGVTYSHCVPTILQMLLVAPAANSVDLSDWKMTIGGAALPKGLLKEALSRGIDVFAGYGMSETCPILTLTRIKAEMIDASDEAQLRIRCKTGLPIPLVDLRIVDEAMNDVPHDGNAVGELVVRTPWLSQLYVGDEAASKELWRGGYLHTQDIASIDPEGYVQITDRLKDVIKTGGEWVSSLAIEDIISQHPDVAESAVLGFPDERWGERPVAFVVLHPNADHRVSAETIKAHVGNFAASGAISRYAVPECIILVDALDRTSVGKTNKKAMREKFLAHVGVAR